jgi:hypothetical protein
VGNILVVEVVDKFPDIVEFPAGIVELLATDWLPAGELPDEDGLAGGVIVKTTGEVVVVTTLLGPTDHVNI